MQEKTEKRNWDEITSQYAEFPLDLVMRAYAKDLIPPEGFEISDLITPDWFIDQVKGVVVFKIHLKPQTKIQ